MNPWRDLFTAPLSPSERELLAILIDGPVSLDDLVARFYPSDTHYRDIGRNTLRVNISMMRRKLKPLGWMIPNTPLGKRPGARNTDPSIRAVYRLERMSISCGDAGQNEQPARQ